MASTQSVVLVVDTAFGARAGEVAERAHVWLVESPENQAAARTFWAVSTQTANPGASEGSVTTFTGRGALPADWAAEMVDTIEDHHNEHAQHPPYSKLVILGTSSTPQLVESLAAAGFKVIKNGPYKVVAEREA